MFPKLVQQRVQFTIGNGLNLGEDTDKVMPVIGGSKFNKLIQDSAIAAAWGGISWNFMQFVKPNLYELKVFTALNAFGLLDEEDGSYKAVITFSQLDVDRPMHIQLFELDGISKYRTTKDSVTMTQDKAPYKTRYTPTVLGNEAQEGENYPSFPVVPLYFNNLRQSALSDAFKATIDAYDVVSSELVNSQTQAEGVYWDLRNYSGEDADAIVQRLQKYRATVSDDSQGTGANNFNVEAPWNGKQATLDMLKREAYDEFKALDMKSLTGGSLTATAVKIATTDIGFAADELETMVCDAIDNMLALLGLEHQETSFNRRTLTNDTEEINNIIGLKDAGLYDVVEAVNALPMIESRKKELLARLETQAVEEADSRYKLELEQEQQQDMDGDEEDGQGS